MILFNYLIVWRLARRLKRLDAKRARLLTRLGATT